MPQGEAEGADELARLRGRVADLEAQGASLRRANEELLTEWKLAEEQAARLIQSSAAQRAAALELARELEQALRRAEEIHQVAQKTQDTLRLVIESTPHGIVMINGAGRLVLVNAQTERLFGYRREELLGRSVELLVPERFRAGFFAAPTSWPVGAGRDLYGRRKDGSEFPVEIGLNPVPTERGVHAVCAVVDITDRKTSITRK
jgi:PAS domain S-box-containing protein